MAGVHPGDERERVNARDPEVRFDQLKERMMLTSTRRVGPDTRGRVRGGERPVDGGAGLPPGGGRFATEALADLAKPTAGVLGLAGCADRHGLKTGYGTQLAVGRQPRSRPAGRLARDPDRDHGADPRVGISRRRERARRTRPPTLLRRFVCQADCWRSRAACPRNGRLRARSEGVLDRHDQTRTAGRAWGVAQAQLHRHPSAVQTHC